MKAHNFFTGLLLACLLLCLPGCSAEEESVRPDLVLGVMPSMDYLPLAVAQREGYFKELGLTVQLHKFYSANERDAAFQSGNVDGVVIDYTGALLQKAGGVDLRLTSRCDAPFYIIASANSGITSPRGLKGAEIAVSRNTVIDYCVDMALESAGIGPEAARKIEINKIPLRYEMLRNGRIDATGLPNPLALLAAHGGDTVLTSNTELGFSITGIMFSGRALADKPEQLRKFYRAYDRGVRYLAEHGPAEVADILKRDLGFTDEILPLIGRSGLAGQGPAALPVYSAAALPSEADLNRAAGWLIRKGLMADDFDYAAITDGRFLDGAE